MTRCLHCGSPLRNWLTQDQRDHILTMVLSGRTRKEAAFWLVQQRPDIPLQRAYNRVQALIVKFSRKP